MAGRSKKWPEVANYALIRAIWPSAPQHPFMGLDDYADFLDFAQSLMLLPERHPESYLLHSVERVTNYIRELSDVPDLSQDDATDIVRRIISPQCETQDASDESVRNTVEFTIRMWLHVEVRLTNSQLYGPHAEAALGHSAQFLHWGSGCTLKTAIAKHFDDQKTKDPRLANTRMGSTMTLDYIVSTYGFGINWTSNVLDHLLVDKDVGEITIYEHKICLSNHLAYGAPNSLIPEAVLGETMDTHNLLLPFEDDSTKALLQKHGKQFYGLGRCGRERVLELDKYVYWRSRIEDLLDILNEPPRGLQQLRLDKRGQNLMQIITFWTAAIVAFLTVMSFVFGVISSIYAKKQYDVALLQYQLALAQACSVSGAATQLPAFC